MITEEMVNDKVKSLQNTEAYKKRQAYEERIGKDWCLKVTGNFVLFEPYETSPYLIPETNSGIILAHNIEKNSKSGEYEDMEDRRFIGTGKVLEIGPDVKDIKPGMDIMYTQGGERLLPIASEGAAETWYIIPGGHIVVYGFKNTEVV